jgi:hypothetical protein
VREDTDEEFVDWFRARKRTDGSPSPRYSALTFVRNSLFTLLSATEMAAKGPSDLDIDGIVAVGRRHLALALADCLADGTLGAQEVERLGSADLTVAAAAIRDAYRQDAMSPHRGNVSSRTETPGISPEGRLTDSAG